MKKNKCNTHCPFTAINKTQLKVLQYTLIYADTLDPTSSILNVFPAQTFHANYNIFTLRQCV